MRVTQMPASGGSNINIRRTPLPESHHMQKGGLNVGEIFSRLQKDDYILLGIIAVLVFEGCDDYILLAALGYLFFMGIKD